MRTSVEIIAERMAVQKQQEAAKLMIESAHLLRNQKDVEGMENHSYSLLKREHTLTRELFVAILGQMK